MTGLVNEPGGLINAWGTINISGSSLTNNGTLSVNTTDASTLTINGTYTQSSTGALNIQLGGSDPALSDLLNVNGLANLAGSMNISLINGFKPVQGDSFKVVTFPGASGSISTYNGLDLSSANIALQPFQNPVNITLTTQTLVSTTVGVTSSGNPSPYGTPVTFTATVAPAYTGLPTPTGSVQFLNGGTPLGSPVLLVAGVATTPALTTLGVGTDTITAKYLGDTNFGLNAGSTTQTISRGTATVTLSANNSSPTYGQVLYFVATVATPFVGGASPTGSAQFQVDGKNFGAPVTLGKGPVASMSTTTLAAGPHTVTVVYTGDSTYGGSSASLGVPVTPGATSRFAVAPPAPSNVAAGAQFAITFEAEDKGGNLTPGYTGTVALTSNDPSASLAPVNYTFTSSDAGTHTFYVTLNATGTQTLNLADKADGISLTVPVTVTAFNPAPTLTAVTPNNALVGGPAVTVTATGTGFVPASTLDYNGVPLPTAFVSSTELTAVLPAADLAAAGAALVTVVSPAPGGGATVPQTFTVNTINTSPASADFVIESDGQVYDRARDSTGTPTGGYQLVNFGQVKGLAVSRLGGGAGFEAFVIGGDNQVYAATVSASGTTERNYFATAYGSIASVSSGTDSSGNPLMFAIGTDNQLYEQRFDASGNATSPSYVKAAYGDFKQTFLTHNAYGNPLLYAIGQDNQVYGLQMDPTGTPVGGLFKVGYGPVNQLAVGHDALNNPELFVVGTDKAVYAHKLDSTGEPIGGYLGLGGVVSSIAVTNDASNNPEAFALGTDGQVYGHRLDGTGSPTGAFFAVAAAPGGRLGDRCGG